jgi:hypothetical protein
MAICTVANEFWHGESCRTGCKIESAKPPKLEGRLT